MTRSSGAAIYLVALTVMAGAAGSACSSGASSSPGGQLSPGDSSTSAASRAASWAADANRICAAADDDIDALPPPRSRREVGSFFASVIVMNKRWNKELTALGAPVGEERRFGRLAKLLAEDERILDRLLAATTAGDRKAFDATMADYRAVGAKENALWRALGATRCAENAYTPS